MFQVHLFRRHNHSNRCSTTKCPIFCLHRTQTFFLLSNKWETKGVDASIHQPLNFSKFSGATPRNCGEPPKHWRTNKDKMNNIIGNESIERVNGFFVKTTQSGGQKQLFIRLFKNQRFEDISETESNRECCAYLRKKFRKNCEIFWLFLTSAQHHQSFKSQSKSSMCNSAITTQIQVPPISFMIQANFRHSAKQFENAMVCLLVPF